MRQKITLILFVAIIGAMIYLGITKTLGSLF